MPLNIADLEISSPDFEPGGWLDTAHAQAGGSVRPRLRIAGVPDGAVELAVICHDPDAPLPRGFTHWTLYGLPPSVTELDSTTDQKFRPGPNGAGTPGYIGPQPPPGHGVHHYYFWVYALDKAVSGTPTREDFLATYAPHVIEQNRVIGTYENV